MKISLIRKKYSNRSTIGDLTVDGKFVCNTLEDMVRDPGVKIQGKTAIPAGAYKVVITYSPRFKRDLPLLLNVPGFEGIRIHTGNDDSDTEGCILVGSIVKDHPDWISNSRDAFARLYPLIEQGVKTTEGVFLVIEDTFATKPTGKASK